MSRIAVLGALLLAGCTEKNTAVPDAAGPPLAAGLKCVLEAPSGWTLSNSPMPDHILELIANAPKMQGRLVLREAQELTLSDAAEKQKQRAIESWGNQPDFTLLREDPMGEGRLLAFQWRRQASAPIERHLIAVLPFESKIVLAFIDDNGATPEAHLLGALGTLSCSPK